MKEFFVLEPAGGALVDTYLAIVPTNSTSLRVHRAGETTPPATGLP